MKKTFTGHTRLFLCISGAIIVIALILQIAGAGLNLGIDFTGGSLLNYSVGEDYDVADVETILASAGYEGSQVTKAAPSDASIALQAERAAAAEAEAADAESEAADAVEPEAADAVEPETTDASTLLNPDKSGIEQSGLTDLQLRLNLVDESAGLDAAIEAAVKRVFPNAKLNNYAPLTNSLIVEKNFDGEFSGGYVAEFEIGEEFDKTAVLAEVEAALADDYAVIKLDALRYDAAAEAAAAEAEAAAEAQAETEPEATAEPEATDAPAEADAPVEESGSALRVLVKIDDSASEVRSLLESQMTAKYPNFSFVSIDHVSAVAGRDLLSNAVKALLIAFACMLLYIALRFDLFSGLAALFGLLHDVLVMCAFMVFFRWAYQVNSSFIAAILTIVGYSINNTIIIFDRIRETSKKPGLTQKPRVEIVETSVASTLSRTVNTSLTTLITLVALYIFGVESIREFAFPLIVGMLAGTYSSVLLSGQVWAMWMEKRLARREAKKLGGKKA